MMKLKPKVKIKIEEVLIGLSILIFIISRPSLDGGINGLDIAFLFPLITAYIIDIWDK